MARAFLEQDNELGRFLAESLTDDILEDLALLPDDPRRSIRDALSQGVDRGLSAERLRLRARVLIRAARGCATRREEPAGRDGPEEVDPILARRRRHARDESRLGTVLALLHLAAELARDWDLPLQVVLLPRGQRPPAAVPTPAPTPGCCAELSCTLRAVATSVLRWSKQLTGSSSRLAANVPDHAYDLLWSTPAHPG